MNRNPILLEQVLFGSPTGEGGFDVLGCTPGVSEEEQGQIFEFSNIGGNIQREVAPEEIFLFYELEGTAGRWAFARVGFKEEIGPRGNDYRVLTLILDETILKTLRWNPFLLEPVIRSQPLRRQPGPLLTLDLSPWSLEFEACRPMIRGVDPSLPFAQLAGVLRRLAEGRIEISVAGRGVGPALCRSLVEALPPKDRRGLSFCTRFAYTRVLSFNLTIFDQRDEGQVSPYLNHSRGPAAAWRGPWGSLPSEKDAFSRWLELLERGLEPLNGLSLLRRPQEAVVLSNKFLIWNDVAKVGGDTESLEISQERWDQLHALARDPGNLPLPSVQCLRANVIVSELRKKVAYVFAGGSQRRGELVGVSSWLAEAVVDAVLVDAIFDGLLASPQGSPGVLERSACILLAIRPGSVHRMDRLYGDTRRDVAFANASEVATWLLDLPASYKPAGLDLVASWFRNWRLVSREACLQAAEEIASALGAKGREQGSAQGLILFLAGLEQAAPDRANTAQERARWFLDLVRHVGPAAGEAFPTLLMARLAAQEGIIGELTQEELARLAAPLADRFSGALVKGLDWAAIEPNRGLLALLDECERRFMEAPFEAASALDFWDLASRVAHRIAELCAPAGESPALDSLAWVLWRAAQVGRRQAPTPDIDQRFQNALLLLLDHCPQGVMHLVVRAALEHLLSGRVAQQDLRYRYPLRVRHQAHTDTHERTHGQARVLSMLVLAHLDRIGFFLERQSLEQRGEEDAKTLPKLQ